MSDLSGGRAQNGSARTGPIPSQGATAGAPLRTPRQIMHDRQAREQRRQDEQKAEEQRRIAEERRKSAERRLAAVTGAPRASQSSSVYTPDLTQQQGRFDTPHGQGAGSTGLGVPTGRTTMEPSPSRQRGPTVTQQDQPRQATTSTASARRPQSGIPTQQIPPANTAARAPQTQTSNPGPTGEARPFPHAFERWEMLSAHWEGLTSYWLRKLEANHEELKKTVPNVVTLNRQITDLSAAGANLFHAVVELQRLRASSERKFQRWFFESRSDTERNREILAQIENQLKVERAGREEATRLRVEADLQAENTRREMAELRRELAISKDEAKRAWEELGRRNQESMETAESLKRGQITLVNGIQVRPHYSGPITIGSASVSRPGTRDDLQYYSSGRGAEDERGYYPQPGSPTNTDPFMETAPPQRYDTGRASGTTGAYQTSSSSQVPPALPPKDPFPEQRPPPVSAGAQDPSSSSRTQTADPVPYGTPAAQRYYQPQAPSASTQQAGTLPATARSEVRSEGSYLDTLSEGETEYVIDPSGNIRRDDDGRPIQFRRVPHSATAASEDYDDDDDDDDMEPDPTSRVEGQGRFHPSTAPGPAETAPPEAPTVPGTSAAAMAGYAPTTTAAATGAADLSAPDYEGTGFGDEWASVPPTRHHHPTRLSDVLEEEEERSSRRTGD